MYVFLLLTVVVAFAINSYMKLIVKPVEGAMGYYVTNGGSLLSRRHKSGLQPNPHTLRLVDRGKGYLCAYVYYDTGVRKLETVHRLVLSAFAGPPPPDAPFALHNDGNPRNNKSSNLRWGTHQENMLDSVSHGTHAGRANGKAQAAFSPQEIEKLREEFAAGNVTIRAMALSHGCGYLTMHRAVFGYEQKEGYKKGLSGVRTVWTAALKDKVFTLRAEGLTGAAIAAALGVSKGSMDQMLFRHFRQNGRV